MKDVLHFTHQELRNKFPYVHFDVSAEGIDRVLVKITKGDIPEHVSVRNVIQHYWNTYQADVAEKVWFEVTYHH